MKDIYMSGPNAAVELARRQQDGALLSEVSCYLGNSFPSEQLTGTRPTALLCRYIARATNEDVLFAREAAGDGLTPYWATYLGDTYTTTNPEKTQTLRPPIVWQKGQRTRTWIADAMPGAQIGVASTRFEPSTGISEYWNNVRAAVFSQQNLVGYVGNTFDMTRWYQEQAGRFGWQDGRMAPYYYRASMALGIVGCAIYEDFDGGPNAARGGLAKFRSDVLLPALDQVKSTFGLDPLVVRLPYSEGLNQTDLSFLDAEQTIAMQKYGTIEAVTPS